MSDDVKRPRVPHPMQPVVRATDGVVRFQANACVRWLLDMASARGIGMNELALQEFSHEDQEQFAQLIGYSVSGFGDLSYVRRTTLKRADACAAVLGKKKRDAGRRK